jgi:hypothetical protein
MTNPNIEIAEILTHKAKVTQAFTVDTHSGALFVAITDEAAADTECDNTDGKSTFLVGDNVLLVGAGISLPESFCLSTPDTVAGAKLPKINIYLYPDAPGFNPGAGLPAVKKQGDIWRATATASGWIIAHIYRYNESMARWDDITTGDGAVYHHKLYPVLANTTGAFFIPFENFEYLLNTFIDVVSGQFYDATSAAYVTGIKLPYELHLSIDHLTVRISMVNVPPVLDTKVESISPFVKITHNIPIRNLADVNT